MRPHPLPRRYMLPVTSHIIKMKQSYFKLCVSSFKVRSWQSDWWPEKRCDIKIILAGYPNKQTLQIARPTSTCPSAEQFDAGDEVKEHNSVRMEITGDITVLGLCTYIELDNCVCAAYF